MKQCIVLVLALAMLLTGCTWLDGEYHSVTPHAYEGTEVSQDMVTVSGYNELRDALVDVVSSGRQKSTFYVLDINEELADQYMFMAISYVKRSTAIGAYAADEIHYEYGTSGGRPAIAVEVTYLHTRNEILRIKKVENMTAVRTFIAGALSKCDPSVVIKVNNYEPMDVVQYVEDYFWNNPNVCMELPQVAVSLYPDSGKERVMEIAFAYQTSRDVLRNMQDMVSPIFSAAELYVRGSEGAYQKFEQLYAFLMERFDYKVETSLTPSYSLLRYGVGDSRAFAMVYSYMCRNANLECQVVAGTRNGEAWYWNQIRVDGVYYHVDLLSSTELGSFTMMLPGDMTGYVWDYSELPED